MAFNEDTRVKIPAIITLTRLGYKYVSLKNAKWDIETNIFTDIFSESIKKINNTVTDSDIKRLLEDINLELDNDDLGRKFYDRLLSTSGIKLIDFENFDNNTFNVVTELPCIKDEEEFRPDITLLINGMPLCFIEVKKPYNREGIRAERNRMNNRFQNKKFKKFINISQILMFSNNQKYDTESITPVHGAFYGTTSTSKAFFNCFREEEGEFERLSTKLKAYSDEIENIILKDTNNTVIKHSPEFSTNKQITTPTNRLILSLFSRERLKDFLHYAIVYVERKDDKDNTILEKHIMRYPQFFASKAIQRKLDKNIKKGIIWHTQGSGKTALAYYNIKWLKDYFSKQGIIPKFYFIVDRLDLKTQAEIEFKSRGLTVHTVNSKKELDEEIKNEKGAISNNSGANEITVINVQKIPADVTVKPSDYNVKVQRIYFIDEAHRSYKPTGCYFANLMTLDKDAIFISLTGTPLLGGKNRTASKELWGDYIHQYYYNSSIADGYTVKLIREDIETQYKARLKEVLDEILIKHGDLAIKQVYAKEQFVKPMLEFIVDDMKKSRIAHNDSTIGAMVVCSSSEQAKMFFDIFNEKYKDKSTDKNIIKSSALILHVQYAFNWF
jgi:type I restriction enzyme R subunit